jgi:hypothetical protein
MSWPEIIPGKVVCLCPTRGRYTLLQKSISMFILQDHPNKELLLLNNHAEPLTLDASLEARGDIRVINYGEVNDMSELHNMALKEVDGEYVSIWEDDDIYLPWHLSNVVRYPLSRPKRMALKPKCSPMLTTVDGKLQCNQGDNYFEASHIVLTETLRHFGFGPHDDPNLANIGFWHWRWLDKVDPVRPSFLDCGYVYVWDRGALDGVASHHSSGNTVSAFQENNQDTGNGVPLKAVDISHLFDALELMKSGEYQKNIEEQHMVGEVRNNAGAYLSKLYSYATPGLYTPTSSNEPIPPVEVPPTAKCKSTLPFVMPERMNGHRFKKLNVFYHLWTEGAWRACLKEHMSAFPRDLIKKCHFYFVVPQGSVFKASDVDIPPHLLTIIEGDDKKDFNVDCEWATLQVLRAFCDAQTETVPVLFLHSKGAHRRSESNDQTEFIKDWCSMMLYFLVGKYQDAFNAMESADAVGVNLTQFSSPHFSGNFWMAWSDYIKTLPYPSKFFSGDRFKSEFWIGTNPNGRLYSLHTSVPNCHQWHYYNSYPKEKYTYE